VGARFIEEFRSKNPIRQRDNYGALIPSLSRQPHKRSTVVQDAVWSTGAVLSNKDIFRRGVPGACWGGNGEGCKLLRHFRGNYRIAPGFPFGRCRWATKLEKNVQAAPWTPNQGPIQNTWRNSAGPGHHLCGYLGAPQALSVGSGLRYPWPSNQTLETPTPGDGKGPHRNYIRLPGKYTKK